MAISIKNPEVEKLARELSRATGETITKAIMRALQERLQRLKGRRTVPDTEELIMEISRRCGALPDLDSRSPEEILAYDESGVFE
ncbi:MAG: type II toxin-antitoxin system VapB family antitoxin [Deltaproteobacteria bacterium]|nr:type II toxin-antitoxin system VapB family antitoxin [Deltaproteobacteria bacterium]